MVKLSLGPLIRARYILNKKKKTNRLLGAVRVTYVLGLLPYEIFGSGAWVEVP